MKFVMALILVTAVHGGIVLLDSARPTQVSGMIPGDTIPEWLTLQLGTGSTPECALAIVFDPLCPACRRANERETALEDVGIPRIWLSSRDAPGLDAFAVRSESELVGVPMSASELKGSLSVRAVPAAILVQAGRTVRSTSAYHGSESDSLLRSKCSFSEQPDDPDVGGVAG